MTAVTPMQVEERLRVLGKELDDAHADLVAAERLYFESKANYEVGVAAARIRVGSRYAERGVKATVQEKEDQALMEVAELLRAYYTAEAVVKAARANSVRVRTQIDIARSVGTSVRASLEM